MEMPEEAGVIGVWNFDKYSSSSESDIYSGELIGQ